MIIKELDVIENNVFENNFFEIILNVGPSTNLYFEDNEKYIQNKWH